MHLSNETNEGAEREGESNCPAEVLWRGLRYLIGNQFVFGVDCPQVGRQLEAQKDVGTDQHHHCVYVCVCAYM